MGRVKLQRKLKIKPYIMLIYKSWVTYNRSYGLKRVMHEQVSLILLYSDPYVEIAIVSLVWLRQFLFVFLNKSNIRNQLSVELVFALLTVLYCMNWSLCRNSYNYFGLSEPVFLFLNVFIIRNQLWTELVFVVVKVLYFL